MQTITLSIQQHHNEPRLFASFPYNKELNAVLKEIPGARWSTSKKQWHFNMNRQVILQLKEKTKNIAHLDLSQVTKHLEQNTHLVPALPSGQTLVTKDQASTYLKPFRAGHLNQNIPGALKSGAFLNEPQKIALRAYI